MEVFMRDIDSLATYADVVVLIAERLHCDDFEVNGQPSEVNFYVDLFRDAREIGHHRGLGTLTVPTPAIGERFLALYGGPGLYLKGKKIQFSRSKSQSGVKFSRRVDYISHNPYVSPFEPQTRDRSSGSVVPLRSIQFGWECRDQVLSIESKATPEDAFINFDRDDRRFRIQFFHEDYNYYIVIHFSQIEAVTAHSYLHDPAIVFSLFEPPTYEMDLKPQSDNSGLSFLAGLFIDSDKGPFRRQLPCLPLPENHERVAPYTSLVVRLVCKNRTGLAQFTALSKGAGFDHIRCDLWDVEHRELFSEEALEEYELLTRKLPWAVAFQVEAIVRKRSVDVREMLDLLPDIRQLIRDKGRKYTAALLRDFAPKVFALYRDDYGEDAVRRCFDTTVSEYDDQLRAEAIKPSNGSLFDAYHVTVTPTTLRLEGPYPERSNRVIRAYKEEYHESFLRVTFSEENRLPLRFDKEVDGGGYIEAHIRPIMLDGLMMMGRKFQFLAYSQSALKEHTVWFVKPFKVTYDDGVEEWIRARNIIESIGNFEDLLFDRNLIFCPARYGARISQAFTATEESITVNIEEIFIEEDIKVTVGNQEYNHTDGVGTMSREVARAIGRVVKRQSPVRQVRIMGGKGMLSTDHTLLGRAIVLRPSMIKFEAPTARNIEIATAFDKPIPYFLNRPLIMILEGLGVRYETFKKFQDRAVGETEDAVQTLSKGAKLLECHGLGTSFRVASVMHSLVKLGVTSLGGDKFFDKAMEFAKNHVLRGIKHKARIPIPGAWTLVGVADVHKSLEPGEIFACVKPVKGKRIYLEGPVVISRSPVIHPGDVQIAHAIGRPPPDSCFEEERLENSVVFSVLGDRPLPSCLGGGDLDGDIYNLIPLDDPELEDFQPKTFRPATYPAAERKLLDRPSTMTDVAEFFMNYLVSDVLGLVASSWLVIADQSSTDARHGIFDQDCLTLANLHSDAVDYPKSGRPVDRKKIPKWKRKEKPDWSAPESIDFNSKEGEKYYRSKQAIGKLFRAIDLPAESDPMRGATRINWRLWEDRRNKQPVEWSAFANDDVYSPIANFVEDFLPDTDRASENQLLRDGESLLARYTTDLQGICVTNTLSSGRNASLSEEEAMIGTIVFRTPKPQRRKEVMARLRDSTDILVRGTRQVLEGGEGDTEERFLQRSWFAWRVSLDKGREFGAQSFGWVALGAVFEAIRRIDERDVDERTSMIANLARTSSTDD